MNTPGSHAETKRSVGVILAGVNRFIKATPFAISVIWRFQPRLFSLLIFSTILDGVAPAVSVWITRYLLDAVVSAYLHQGEALYLRTVAYIVILQLVVSVFLGCSNKIMTFFKGVLAMKLSLNMQTDLIEKTSRLGMKDFDNPNVYDMITRANGEAQSNKPFVIVSAVCNIAASSICWLSFAGILLTFSPILLLVSFAICIPYFILNVYFGRAHYKLQYGRTHERREAGYLSSCFTNRRYLPEIITLDVWSFLQSKWSNLAARFMMQDILLSKHRASAETVVILITHLGQNCATLYIFIKCLLHFGNYTVGQIMMYIQSFAGAVNALAQAMQQLSGLYESSCFLQNYQEFLELQKVRSLAKQPPRRILKEIESVEFCNVSYTYPGSARRTLHNINVTFKKGQSTLLVGRNGAGKTTIARMLVGLYDPTEGQILINGHDMKEYDLKLLRKQMSIIFQDFVRYALSAQENIGLGAVEHIHNRECIIKASKAAGLHESIACLPNGYATMLGREFQGGHDLSLGEWQRVCLARLFMRDASLTVYDEPSASLDVETESELLREISSSGRDKICILISHRMLRSDIADRIVVVEAGKIVEQGNHSELVNHGGRYAHLWNTYHRLANGKANDDLSKITRESSAEVSRTWVAHVT